MSDSSVEMGSGLVVLALSCFVLSWFLGCVRSRGHQNVSLSVRVTAFEHSSYANVAVRGVEKAMMTARGFFSLSYIPDAGGRR